MTARTSIEWMRRTHAMMPLTPQEDGVSRLLIDERLSFKSHYVFDLAPSRRYSIDFLIFYGPGIVLECTTCRRKKWKALAELRRRSAFIDYRFGLLKEAFPKLACGALIEAPNEDPEHLSRQLKPILKNSNFLVTSSEQLHEVLLRVRGGSC